MGNEISLQLRSPDRVTVSTTSNDSPRSPKTGICQISQNIKEALPDSNNCLTLIEREKTVKDQRASENRRTTMSASIDIAKRIAKLEIEETAAGYPPAQANNQGIETENKFSSSILTAGYCNQKYKSKLKDIQQTLISLDDSLRKTRGLEAEKSLRYSQLKTQNMSLQVDLDKAKKRNKNMLNLFRQNAAEVGFGHLKASSTLPEPLRKDVRRIWSQKYDALLERTNQLQKEVLCAKISLKEKDRQIEDLQQRLLNLADELIEREKTIKKICTKFLSLKQRKDEQEILLRGSVETLQDALQKATASIVTSSKSESCMTPSKDALIAREKRRSDRLAYENSLLRALLQEAKRSCRSSRTSSTISLCDKNI